ncbi:MAG: hypothetical protein CH6_0329 [Candidatus Kapaibacterium sp.]|nr:MAG: hypothetical protein CH6_0329 [Candidatus Kapabacteria bacterium]
MKLTFTKKSFYSLFFKIIYCFNLKFDIHLFLIFLFFNFAKVYMYYKNNIKVK